MTEMWHKANSSLWIVLCLTLMSHECSCQSDGQSKPNHLHHECTVRKEDLHACENDKRVCVNNIRDCDSVPVSYSDPASLNISCYFHPVEPVALSCSWHHESRNPALSTCSLIFSQSSTVYSCPGLLNPNGFFSITIKQTVSRQKESWFGPHLVDVWEAVKAPVPSITWVNSTDHSLSVVWTASTEHSRCQVRYRVSNDHTWTKVPDHVSVELRETVVYVIDGLQPYTGYRVGVACVGTTGLWSEWSSEITGMTLERRPSKGPEVCFRMEPKPSSEGLYSLTLMWKALDVLEAGGRVLGHQVTYTPTKKTGRRAQNVTFDTAGLRTELEVWEEQGEVTVTAYNQAGSSPTSHLRVHRVRHQAVPSVRSLWVSSRGVSLVVQWDMGASSLPVSEFVIEWSSHTQPASSRWRRVDGHSRSAVLAEHIQRLQTYDVSVYPIYHTLCGPPQSLTASLEHGALLKAVGLHAVVTETMVTVSWVWKKEGPPRRVGGYRLLLRQEWAEQAVSIWPDVSRHTFFNLSAHTEYSVHLLADNTSTEILLFTSAAFYDTETIATVTPLTVLTLCLGLLLVLSRTLYKEYFFPQVADPQVSRIGQWLLTPHCKETVMKSILKLEDFLVTDLLLEGRGLERDPEPHSPAEDHSSTHTSPSHTPLTLTHTRLPQAYPGAGTLQQTPTLLLEYIPNSSAKPTAVQCVAPSMLSPRIPLERACIMEYVETPGLVSYTVSTTIECEADYIQNTFCQQH